MRRGGFYESKYCFVSFIFIIGNWLDCCYWLGYCLFVSLRSDYGSDIIWNSFGRGVWWIYVYFKRSVRSGRVGGRKCFC